MVYCQDYRRKEKHENVQFDFLGYSYQPRARKNPQERKTYTAFTAEISRSNQKKIREAVKATVHWRNTVISIQQIAEKLNPKIRGWLNYYGLYSKRKLKKLMKYVDGKITGWIGRKYKITSVRYSYAKLKSIKQEKPLLFYHWAKWY